MSLTHTWALGNLLDDIDAELGVFLVEHLDALERKHGHMPEIDAIRADLGDALWVVTEIRRWARAQQKTGEQ